MCINLGMPRIIVLLEYPVVTKLELPGWYFEVFQYFQIMLFPHDVCSLISEVQ